MCISAKHNLKIPLHNTSKSCKLCSMNVLRFLLMPKTKPNNSLTKPTHVLKTQFVPLSRLRLKKRKLKLCAMNWLPLKTRFKTIMMSKTLWHVKLQKFSVVNSVRLKEGKMPVHAMLPMKPLLLQNSVLQVDVIMQTLILPLVQPNNKPLRLDAMCA